MRLILIAVGFVSWQGVIAAEATLIRRADSLPETTPWDLEALSNPPEHEWAAGNEIRGLYYQGESYRGQPTRVFAWYATPGSISGEPTKDKNLPVIVLVHGGGGTAFPHWVSYWASRGYAAIAMDLAGYGPNSKVRLPDGGPDQGHDTKFHDIGKPVTEQWTYHAVANVIRAHSLVLSFDEVDPDRTALTGHSWGGYLTCLVAGLDNRFSAAIPLYGCGFLDENGGFAGELANMSPEHKQRWMQLWDPSQYVGSTSVPMLFVNGGKDFFYAPDIFTKTYALVKAPKNLYFVPDFPHAPIIDRPKALEVFVRHHLEGGVPLAKIATVNVGETNITASVDAQTTLASAALHYTVNSPKGNPLKRQWVSKPAGIRQNSITAELPPADTAIWFLTVTDDRDTVVSSAPVFP